MCECGCAEFDPFAYLPAPNGVYVLGTYAGCPDCQTGPALRIWKMPRPELESWGFEGLPEMTFDKRQPDEFLPLVEGAALFRKLRETEFVDAEMLDEGEVTQALREAAQETIAGILRPRFKKEKA